MMLRRPFAVVAQAPAAEFTEGDILAARTASPPRWLVAIRGDVYDVTDFLDQHPGGRDAIENEGADATAAWEAIGHSRAARRLMRRTYRVGRLASSRGKVVSQSGDPEGDDAAAAESDGEHGHAQAHGDIPTDASLPFPGPPPDPRQPQAGQYRTMLAHTLAVHELSLRWAQQYGRLVSFRVGAKPFLQVSDPDVAEQIWVANPPKQRGMASARDPSKLTRGGRTSEEASLVDDIASVFGTGILTVEHERWPERRALLRPSFTVRRIRDTYALVLSHALRLKADIDAANADVAAKAGASSQQAGQPQQQQKEKKEKKKLQQHTARLDARELTTDVAFSIILHATLGRVADAFTPMELRGLRQAFDTAFERMFRRDTKSGEFAAAVDTMQRFAGAAVEELLRAHATAGANKSADRGAADDDENGADTADGCPVDHEHVGLDILTRLASAAAGSRRDSGGSGNGDGADACGGRRAGGNHAASVGAAGHSGITGEDLRGELLTTIFAGHETSSNTVAWLLWELACHPDLQVRAQAEIDTMFETLASSGEPTASYHDVLRLRYLSRVIREGMRLHTVVPVTARELDVDVEVAGHTVCAGTTVMFSAHAMHHDPTLWRGSHPSVFDPDRPWNAAAFRPFTIGPRDCIGRNFALLELRCILAVLLRSYEIVPAANAPPRGVSLGTVQPDAVWVRFVPRPGQPQWM